MTKNNIRLTILAPKELHDAAKAKADAEDVTLSQVIRWWLRAWVRGDLPTTPSPMGKEPQDDD
jgi:hypothetical protein